jgi:uncharacterized membrane protein
MHGLPSFAAAFAASLVEFVEVRGWGGAIGGACLALALLATLVATIGPALARIPLGAVHLVLGTLLLLFGLRWLRKAVLRAAGVIPLHDEAALYARQTETLRRAAPRTAAWDTLATATAFKITMVEGVEVVFIVIAMGAGGANLLPAGLGAVAALAAVILLGIALHRPIASIPENSLKFGVGVLLCAFGTFWVGEGLGLAWPGDDLWLVALAVVYGFGALAVVRKVEGKNVLF